MRFLLSLLLGALAATAFEPLNLWPATLVGFAIWLRFVQRAPTLGGVLLHGWLFGVGHMTVANLWIQPAFTFQDAMPHWLGYLAVVLLALYLAIYPMLAAGLAWRLARGSDGPFVLVAAAGWIATEYLRGTLFTGYAWDPLAVVWVPGPAQIARFTGTYALSGLTVLAAGCLMLLARRAWRLPAASAAVLGALWWLALTPAPAPSPSPLLRVVQPNLPEEERPTDDYAENNLARLEKLTGGPGAKPRLIVWPEGAVRFPIEDGYPRYIYWEMGSAALARARIAALEGRNDLVLTGGAPFYFDRRGRMTAATNAILAIGPDARIHGRYDKAHLVPYGEYLPARPLLEAIGLSRLVPGDVDFIPGPGPRTLDLPGFGRIGMQICYEIIFSGEVVDRANRPRLIFNPSNDAWYGTLGPPQHLAQARLRAIEEGLPIVRATPTGISAIIDATGALVAIVPLRRTGAAEAAMPNPLPPTLFAQFGNWMAVAVAGLLLLTAIAMHARRR